MPTPTLTFDQLIQENLSFLDFTDTDLLASIEVVKAKVWFALKKFVDAAYTDFDSYSMEELMVAADYVAYLVTEKQTQTMGLSATASSENLYVKKEKVDVLEREFSERKGILTVSELLSNYKSTVCINASELGWILPFCDGGNCGYDFLGVFYPNSDDYLY